jgi:hypothetical protein
MAASDSPATPDSCPFCGVTITGAVVGFVNHLEDRPACREAYDS